ncbi:MAG: chorismate synthase [Corallococcus sp.]|nr:chorismate synthase [Corallococcus sp.]MCM1360049.1 chorismate synthase [Corallococcus sp.]MCM1395606.1 chorismate synthase [Corallococcus sp.]
MISFEFEGTSHGDGYRGVIKGLPQGFVVDIGQVNAQLLLRKRGFGRSERQNIPDEAVFEGGKDGFLHIDGEVRFFVPNSKAERRPEITALRSGHSDVTGKARFPNMSVREIAEISSARNSACYVVLGAICKQILAAKNIFTYHFVERLGGVSCRSKYVYGKSEAEPHFALLHCPSKTATELMEQKIENARRQGNSLGGIVAVGATGVPMGVGELLPYSKRLDAQIAANLVGIPSVKGITFGKGRKLADTDGRTAADSLVLQNGQIAYSQNKCGGIVAGISTGQDILCRLVVKPVPTVKGVFTVDVETKQTVLQHFERADTCVVPNVGVIAENILAYVMVNQMQNQQLL